ncbi:MAG: sulfotransferase, partial [Blastocatellia bacterium]|nr:sulfotransferase [Blastocatellia bacterium]
MLKQKVGLSKKFVHVIRNPFDTIATTFHKTSPKNGESTEEHLSREIRNYFARCSAVRMIEQEFGAGSILHLHHESLIAEPSRELARVCEFLGAEAYPEYLRDCSGILKTTP